MSAQLGPAVNWIRQALADYANAQPPAAREATVDMADRHLQTVLVVLREAQQAKVAPPEAPPA
ncbi:MAG: hypothetical protein KAX77_05045 [Xanthomonadales bacterium]|nr:hypothetical protein [Xanthomonadales bacterium]